MIVPRRGETRLCTMPHGRRGPLSSAPAPPLAPRLRRLRGVSPRAAVHARGPRVRSVVGGRRGVALAAVLPMWIAPLFYRLTPLTDGRLGERLLAVARRAGVEAIGVFVADQSRKSRTANAAVVGLGRTRRIVLFDTLLSDFPPEEIESVLAHELGHHVHGDVRRGLLVNGAVRLVTFWLAALALDAGVPLFGLDGRADPAGLPWLALVLVALALVQLPLANGFSRWLERRADDFALATTGDAPAFIAAMERLGRLNLAEPSPSRFRELVFYSHPALERRIARARASLT